MKKIVFALTLFLFQFSLLTASASDGGLVEAGKLYDVPTGSFDIDYTTTETIAEGKTVVVFYYTNKSIAFTSRNFAFGSNYKEFSYANEVDADRNLIVRFFDTKGIVKAGQPLLINLYSPLEDNAKWAYVICNEDEKQTIANPFGGTGEDTDDLPGQTEAAAIELTTSYQPVTAQPSKTSATEYTIYAKFTPVAEGRVFTDFPEGDVAHYIKEEGGSFKTFSNENGYHVQPGTTYYVWYRYNTAAKGSIRYILEEPKMGEARSTAITVDGEATFDLLGKPSIGKDYFYNVTTWFRLDSQSLAEYRLMKVTLSGGNLGEVALFREDAAEPIKAYGIGEGTGLIPINSTAEFDIDPTAATYYVAITQDNTGGHATFSFTTVEEGQTKSTAIEATVGNNTGIAGKWYKYTHEGNNMVSITNVTTVYNEGNGLVSTGNDVKLGFRMRNGETIYFQANGNFTISISDIPEGMGADNPVILTLDENGLGSFQFTLNGSDSDATRYIQLTATESGTFMYGTDNRKVVEMAFGSSVTDLTTGKKVSVVQEKQNFGAEYFTYTWQVTAGHIYLIEQTLQNNLGRVTFMATFSAAAEGEVIDKPIEVALDTPINLGRSQGLTRYYRFIAKEDGTYLLSAHVQGYVRSYDSEGNSTSIQRDYANGTDFHEEYFALTSGESLVFSIEPSAPIEHLAGGIQDFFIPNYYVVVSMADTEGLNVSRPLRADEGCEYTIGSGNIWYGPIKVPAGESFTLDVTNFRGTDRAAVFFANEKGQWICNESEILYDTSSWGHSYSLRASSADRIIYLMSCGMTANGTWHWGDPETGIRSASGTSGKSMMFNLSGQRTNHADGIVIKDGRKTIVK